MEQAKKRYFRQNLQRTLMAAYEEHGIKFIDEYDVNLQRTIREQAVEDAERPDSGV